MPPCPSCAMWPHHSSTGCRYTEAFQRGCEEIRRQRLSGWERVVCRDAGGLKLNARPTSSRTHTNTHANKRDNCLWFNKNIQFQRPHLFHFPQKSLFVSKQRVSVHSRVRTEPDTTVSSGSTRLFKTERVSEWSRYRRIIRAQKKWTEQDRK